MKSRIALVVSALAVTTVLAACGSSSKNSSSTGGADSSAAACAKTTSISIATTPYQDSLIMTLGNKLGWYAKACLKVSFTNVDFTNEMSTVVSGTTNVAWYNTTGVVSTYHQDNSLVYVYPWDIFDQGAAMMARPSANLTTYDEFVKQGKTSDDAVAAVIDELHGKTVITTIGSDTGEDLVMALRRQNKPQDWVKIINLGQDQGLATFLRGTGDAYIGGIPQRQTLVSKNYDTLLAGSNLTPAPLNGFVTKRSFYDANKDALLSLMQVTFMAVRYTEAHLDEVAAYVSKTFNAQTGGTLSADDFKTFWQKYEHYPVNAGDAQKLIFTQGGIGYWKAIWQQDNDYLYTVTKAIPASVPESAFLGEEFQKDYVAKFGSDEKGYWDPTGSLS